MRILLIMLFALCAIGAFAADLPEAKDAAYVLTWENLLSEGKSVTLKTESWDGKFRTARLDSTSFSEADFTALKTDGKTLKGEVKLTIPPVDPAKDKPVAVALTIDSTFDGLAVVGTYSGTRGETKIEGKLNGAYAARPTSNAGAESGGRQGDYTKMAAKGDHLRVIAATFFGSVDPEEYIGTGGLDDESIVAIGNAWGPHFPDAVKATVLGKGTHTGAKNTDAKGKLDRNDPDMAGFVVVYNADLSKINRVLRFDWGVASISASMVTNDGKALLIAGRCGKAFDTFTALTAQNNTQPADAAAKGDANVFVAQLTPEGKVTWIWTLQKMASAPAALFTDEAGLTYVDCSGLHRISADGKELKLINSKTDTGTAKWLGVDPKDGGVYYGGDRNTKTNMQPYRQPYFYKMDAEGKRIYTLWEPTPKDVGSDAGSMESDSSPRGLAWSTKGDMIISGWSDGGNSVLTRQPLDWHKPVKGDGMGIMTFGMKNANSLAHIMVIDAQTQETKLHQWWASFIPTWFNTAKNRGAPNACFINQIKTLADDSVAITGSSATALIQTPNPFWTDPRNGDRYGGSYVSVFKPDMTNLLFSSYLPGYETTSIGIAGKGLVVVGGSTGVDGSATPTLTPTKAALQPDYAGATDAHIILLAP